MLSEEGIEFIAKIGNLPEVKKHLEPDIMEPLVLDQAEHFPCKIKPVDGPACSQNDRINKKGTKR